MGSLLHMGDGHGGYPFNLHARFQWVLTPRMCPSPESGVSIISSLMKTQMFRILQRAIKFSWELSLFVFRGLSEDNASYWNLQNPMDVTDSSLHAERVTVLCAFYRIGILILLSVDTGSQVYFNVLQNDCSFYLLWCW